MAPCISIASTVPIVWATISTYAGCMINSVVCTVVCLDRTIPLPGVRISREIKYLVGIGSDDKDHANRVVPW